MTKTASSSPIVGHADARPAASAAPRFAGLDTLRALAIVAVILYHLNWRLPACFAVVGHFGWMGVDLFFVLSGYLIGSQLLRPIRDGRRIDIRDFYRRRAYRILPAYLVVLALYLVWPGWHEAEGFSPLWQFLTFTENLFVDYSRNFAFSHVWSLCVEEHFYLLLPPIVLLLSRRPSLARTAACLALLFVAGAAVRWYELVHVLQPIAASGEGFDTKYIERIYYPTYARLDGLLAGVALALIKLFRPRWWSALVHRANTLLLVGAACFGCAVWLFYHRFSAVTGVAAVGTVIGFPILSLGLALWVLAAADLRCWLARFRIPGAQLVATLAFSLYLTHKEVGHVVAAWLPGVVGAQGWICVPIYAASCLAIAALLYVTVERPMLALRERRVVKSDTIASDQPAF